MLQFISLELLTYFCVVKTFDMYFDLLLCALFTVFFFPHRLSYLSEMSRYLWVLSKVLGLLVN